jgi:hypothetical protein
MRVAICRTGSRCQCDHLNPSKSCGVEHNSKLSAWRPTRRGACQTAFGMSFWLAASYLTASWASPHLHTTPPNCSMDSSVNSLAVT